GEPPGDDTPADAPADSSPAEPAPDDAPRAGDDASVVVFDRTPVYFAGADNRREVDARASFPSDGAYSRVTLRLALDCPGGGCDPWDRLGSLSLVAPGEAGGEAVLELVRFVTPYGVGGAWDIDVTELRPLLSGDVALRAFIDTWVGPGSPYGDGWLLSARFEMTGGVPSPLPVAVAPIWAPRMAPYGDPARPIASTIAAVSVAVPAATSFALRTLVTGHGQGNLDNCGEFCSRTHAVVVGGQRHEQVVWRDDCETTAVQPQAGTWRYPRAGWCPGADVRPWRVDVTADLAPGAPATIGYDVEAYENTCRPDAASCGGCVFGTSCAYDGGAHTEPGWYVSGLLIAYR
ncbi:MAG TPA: peptide-N-glycosidase F-related protein, partial [Myxococcota bacterium]|nr:peptide-N-glycosidase F-related protein [Myxococcota bacterium]